MSRYLTLLREQKNSALTCEKSELCEITPVFQGGRVLNSHNSLISHTRTEKSTGREAKRFCITASMQQTIRDYTEGRLRANDATRSAAACHGSDEANRHYEYFGMAAERGFIEELERHGLNPQGYVFLAGTAREKRRLSEPDFTYCGLRFDIKACPPKQGSKPDDVSINQGKHENPNTRPDWYVLCLFTSETDYTVALLPAAEVDRWELRPGAMKPDGTRRKPYYAISRRLLPCLHDLSELTALTNADAVENDPQPFREDDADAEEDPADDFDDLLSDGKPPADDPEGYGCFYVLDGTFYGPNIGAYPLGRCNTCAWTAPLTPSGMCVLCEQSGQKEYNSIGCRDNCTGQAVKRIDPGGPLCCGECWAFRQSDRKTHAKKAKQE